MKSTILLLPGDGIGPEVVRSAGAVLRAIAARFSHQFDLREAPIGGSALRQGLPPLPDDTLAAARESDAILLGAVGDPAFDTGDSSRRPETALLQIRRELKLYANLRPREGLAGPGGLRAVEANRRDRYRHAGGPGVDRRLVLRRTARHRGRRQFRAQHDAILATRDRADRASRVRRCAAPPEARHVGGQGERARDVAPVAAGGRRSRERVPGRRTRSHAGRFLRDANRARAGELST